jgi:hypothetical protein
MNKTKTLRGATTRRIQGRRGITPIKPRRKRILKTRSRKSVENGVSIQQHTGSRSDGKWSAKDQTELGGDCEWKGNKDSGVDRERKDSQEHKELVNCGNEEDSAESVYPGSLQELHELSELAVADITNETELQEEEDL